MHRARVNQCDIQIRILTDSPLAILEGRYKKDKPVIRIGLTLPPHLPNKDDFPLFPDQIPVSRSTDAAILDRLKRYPEQAFSTALADLDYYVPGATVRGALRSYSEKILRTLGPSEEKPLCCNPFETDSDFADRFCGTRLQDYECDRLAYKCQCPVCSLFGSTRVAGRIRVEDFGVAERGLAVLRDSVALDRFTGGVAGGGPFRTMLLEDYAFEGRIRLFNFECWQLGFLAYAFRDLCLGEIPLGWGKSKGYGQVRAEVQDVCFFYYGETGLTHRDELEGVGHRKFSEEAYVPEEKISLQSDELDMLPRVNPIRHGYRVRDPHMREDSGFWSCVAAGFDRARPGFVSVDEYGLEARVEAES